MKIKNANLANQTLGTKEGPIEGDAHGVFDVPETLGKMLIETSEGLWTLAKKGRAAAPEPPADDLTEEVNAAVDEVTTAEDEGGDIDIDSLTKGELLTLAEDHGIDVDATMRKADIKEAIEAALGGQ